MPDIQLQFGGMRLPEEEAREAGFTAYHYFTNHRTPELSPLTFLSHAVRRYDDNKSLTIDNKSLTIDMRRQLVNDGFLVHGERTPIRRRLRLPGVVAVSLVIPDLHHGNIEGEFLQEPFVGQRVLDSWYRMTQQPSLPATRLSWIRD